MQNSDLPDIDFGTSGLRGPAMGFSPQRIAAYVGAFLDEIAGVDGAKTLCLAADLRASSPTIAAAITAAVKAKGWRVIYGGNVPTPALALYALNNDLPALMVTGSHIPPTYNGIKFYRRDGELLKKDEAPIRIAAEKLLALDISIPALDLPPVETAIATEYKARYLGAFAKDALAGLRIGIDLHSAVGRDIMVEILETLGATVKPFRRSDTFIAVDTEALDPVDIECAKTEIKTHSLDAVISTDGDGDRPLMIDADGEQINGDVLGALTAKALHINIIVTPLSSTSAIEKSNWFDNTVRTKIGSPHVVSAMSSANNGALKIAGFEANGGFLTETDMVLPNGHLSRLPTRDAVLPIITVLAAANIRGCSVRELTDDLPARFMIADRIKQVDPEKGKAVLESIAQSEKTRIEVDQRLATPVNIDTLDGTRLTYADASIIHFRQSGNAPEMRCYIETETPDRTKALLRDVMESLTIYLKAEGCLR